MRGIATQLDVSTTVVQKSLKFNQQRRNDNQLSGHQLSKLH